jgi:small subunit ribosomal protein S2
MSKSNLDLKALIKSGVHFGHETSRWNPKMAPYIWGSKNGIHLIDISKTAYLLEQAAKFLESIAAEGKSILWVGTKKPAQEIVLNAARELNLPFVVNRWVGGTFSNYRQVRKSVANLLQYEDIVAKAGEFHYSKKELNTYQKRIDRLIKNVGGIRNLVWPVGAVVVVDVKREHVAIKEALATGIPIVAIVDTNSDPSMIDYVIPANDDAPRSINVLIDRLVEAVKKGQEVAATKPQELSAQEIFESVFEAAPGLEEEEEDAAAKRNKAAGGGASRAKKQPAIKPKHHKRVPEGKKFTDEATLEKEEKPKVKERSAEEPAPAVKKAEPQEKPQTESPEKE